MLLAEAAVLGVVQLVGIDARMQHCRTRPQSCNAIQFSDRLVEVQHLAFANSTGPHVLCFF